MARKKTYHDQFEASFAELCEKEDNFWWPGTANLTAYGLESPAYGAGGPLAESLLMFIYHDLEEAASGCASPIETAMFMSLVTTGLQQYDGLIAGKLKLGDLMAPDVLEIESQFEVGKFRADFRITHRTRWGYGDDETAEASALVECDGHDFHDRTKEQAKRDKARDRSLQAAGHKVLRFTGSEIWADPLGVAVEACSIVEDAVRATERG